MLPFVLVIVGIFLIFLEFYLPGAVMAVIGSIFILAGTILFAAQSQSILATTLFIISIAIAIAFLVRWTLQRIVRARPQYSIYSGANQTGYVASTYDKSAIGKVGIVLSDLKPGGYILIEEQQHAAISIEGYVPKGESVKVIGGQEQSLLVTLNKKEIL